MVGGDKAVFDACADLFTAMGGNVFHAGKLGNGLAMKLGRFPKMGIRVFCQSKRRSSKASFIGVLLAIQSDCISMRPGKNWAWRMFPMP